MPSAIQSGKSKRKTSSSSHLNLWFLVQGTATGWHQQRDQKKACVGGNFPLESKQKAAQDGCAEDGNHEAVLSLCLTSLRFRLSWVSQEIMSEFELLRERCLKPNNLKTPARGRVITWKVPHGAVPLLYWTVGCNKYNQPPSVSCNVFLVPAGVHLRIHWLAQMILYEGKRNS